MTDPREQEIEETRSALYDLSLNDALRELRQNAGLTPRGIAVLMGSTAAEVRAFERKELDPRQSWLRAYCKAVGIGLLPFRYDSVFQPALEAGRAPRPEGLADLLAAAVQVDGDWHKQWYLEQIAAAFRIELPNHEPGIAP